MPPRHLLYTLEQEARDRYAAGLGTGPWWQAIQGKGRKSIRMAALVRGVGFAVARGTPQISPWDAILNEVRRSAHRVAWLEAKIADVANVDDDLLPPSGAAWPWVQMQNAERKHLLEASKIAFAAGISAHMVRVAETEAQMMAQAAKAALETLNLSEEESWHFLNVMSGELKRLELEVSDALEI